MLVEALGFDIVFRYPERILLIPLAVFLFGVLMSYSFFYSRKVFASNEFLRLHASERETSFLKYFKTFVALSLVATFLLLVFAEPEKKFSQKEPVYGGVRIAFLLDVSLSMKYAKDADPFLDRLSAAKNIIGDLSDMTLTDEKLRGLYFRALIPFAGSAQTYLHFTKSYEEFAEAIEAINETAINDPGSDIFWAFYEYEILIKNYKKNPEDIDLLVFVSDGGRGDISGRDLPRIKALIKRLQNTAILALGVGGVEIKEFSGGTIRRAVPAPLVRRDDTGAFVGYILGNPKDKNSIVYSELDERMLSEVASSGGNGTYIHYSESERIKAEFKRLIIENRKIVGWNTRSALEPMTDWFLFPAFFLIFISFGYARRLFLWR